MRAHIPLKIRLGRLFSSKIWFAEAPCYKRCNSRKHTPSSIARPMVQPFSCDLWKRTVVQWFWSISDENERQCNIFWTPKHKYAIGVCQITILGQQLFLVKSGSRKRSISKKVIRGSKPQAVEQGDSKTSAVSRKVAEGCFLIKRFSCGRSAEGFLNPL